MSGFFGMVRQDGKAVEEPLLQKIADELTLRGPDGTSLWRQANVGGCYTWMRTGPAPQAEHQPVILGNRFFLWGDLRLDARQQLQQQLSLQNFPDAPALTSEHLLLHAWAKWGLDALEHIIGDFSFALWDAHEQILWCARDFVGSRPFYYAHVGDVFCFSNTLRIFRLVPEVSRELNESFLGDFLIEGWNVDPTRTVYRDIRRLPAGHLLRFSNRASIVRRFLKLPIEEPLRLKRPEDYLEVYRSLLTEAVNDRLPEHAAALYLSGGLDSATVCAVAGRIASGRAQKEKLKSFTLSWKPFFDDPEPAFATYTAQHLGLSLKILQETELKPFEGAGSQDGSTPEPDNEAFFARERRLSLQIAAHANVVLSGDGGDDVLMGQAWPYLTYLLRKGSWKEFAQEFGGYLFTHKRLPPLGGGFRSKFRGLLGGRDSHDGFPVWLNEDFIKRANLKQRWLEVRNRPKNTEHPLHPNAYDALHDGAWADVLETEDAGWNRVKLETRAPLLDLRILTFLLRLPPVPWCMNKELCRQAMKDALPSQVLRRPKTPLLYDPFEASDLTAYVASAFPKVSPGKIEVFVNWPKWCETFYHSKGSLNSMILRPVSLFHWLNAVVNV